MRNLQTLARLFRTCTFFWHPARAILEQVLKIVPPPSIPMAVARALVKAFFSTPAGVLTLRFHRGDFYRWNGRHWLVMDPKDVRGEAYRRLEHAHFKHPEKGTLPFAPSQAKIDNVVDALRAVVELDTKAAAPCWTGAAGPVQPSANEIVPMKNGLLHVPTRTPQSHTPYFFCHHSLELPTLPMLIPRRGG